MGVNIPKGYTEEQYFAQLYLMPMVELEMEKQVEKWGVQNHPSYSRGSVVTTLPSADLAKRICDTKAQDGTVSWTDIFLEEVLEAVEEARGGNIRALREELIQVAAVAASWILSIDRNER